MAKEKDPATVNPRRGLFLCSFQPLGIDGNTSGLEGSLANLLTHGG